MWDDCVEPWSRMLQGVVAHVRLLMRSYLPAKIWKKAQLLAAVCSTCQGRWADHRIIEADYNRPRQTLERHQLQNVKILCAAMRGWLFIAPNAWHRPRLPTPWWSRTRPCTDLHWLSSCGGLRNSWPKKRSWRSAEHSCPPMLVPC